MYVCIGYIKNACIEVMYKKYNNTQIVNIYMNITRVIFIHTNSEAEFLVHTPLLKLYYIGT